MDKKIIYCRRSTVDDFTFEVNIEKDISVYNNDELQEKFDSLEKEIDILTNKSDKIDYIVAAASGVLCGIFDSIF